MNIGNMFLECCFLVYWMQLMGWTAIYIACWEPRSTDYAQFLPDRDNLRPKKSVLSLSFLLTFKCIRNLKLYIVKVLPQLRMNRTLYKITRRDKGWTCWTEMIWFGSHLFIDSFIFYMAYPFWGVAKLKPIPADVEWGAGYAVGRPPVYHRWIAFKIILFIFLFHVATVIIMKVWIVCVLLYAVFTSRTATGEQKEIPNIVSWFINHCDLCNVVCNVTFVLFL